MPASGWDARFERVRAELNLPPGHRLVAVLGVDSAPGSWWERWGLWSAFGVCIVVALTYRLADRAAAAIALGALLLTYQEGPAYIWLWANALLALAAAGAAPEGRLRDWARRYRVVALALLAVALLPLLWGQLRLALHPQLEAIAAPAAPWGAAVVPAAAPSADMPAPPPPEAAAAEAELQADVVDEKAVSRPMPPARLDRKAIAGAVGGADAAVVVASEYAAAVATRYAPGTLLQAGPGLPDWSYRRYPLLWAGPVTAEDTLRVLYVGPLLLGAWRIAGVALLALWFAALLRLASGGRGSAWLRTRATDPAATAAGASTALAALSPALVLLALATTGLAPPATQAASTPDPALLETLRQRLLAPPACVPDCAEILRARVEVDGERLSIVLEASALADVAVALPAGGDRWQIESASVDGAAGIVVAREGDGTPWMPLRAGARTIRLAGRIADVDALPLLFAQPPRTIEVEARGWEVGGVEGGRLLSGALELTRRRGAAPSAGDAEPDAAAGGAEFLPFVRVFRQFTFGPEWSAETLVRRLAPERAAFTVEVPLVAGESVLTAGLDVDAARRARVGLAAGQPQAGWTSTLARAEALVLAAPPASANRAEVWRFVAGPEWALAFDGPPAVLPDDPDGPQWIYTYYPRPGESLRVGLRRPAAVPGATLAIDAVEHRLRVGARSADATLLLRYRSTQGGRHVIALPPDARVTSVTVDDAPQQLRPEGGELSLGLLPGTHRVEIGWESPQGVAAASRPPAVDLRSPAGNVRTTLELPADGRWILFALGRGAGVGPAVLYWSELLAFLALALLLGRLPASPLRPSEWLVLGLGLSTQSWGVFALVAAWLLALRWRASWDAQRASRVAFNLVQLVLAALSVVALSSLVFSGFQYGFLSTPDMGIVGAGSSGNVLQWFADRTAGPLPQPLVVSVPLWVYKALVFAWALAVAWLLAMRWLPWAWRAWSAGGYWRSKGELSPASAP
jgi:hypothetical protein